MANVAHAPIGRHLRPATGSFGFGFACTSKMNAWPTTAPAFGQFASNTNTAQRTTASSSTLSPAKSQVTRKRSRDDDGSGDVMMENRSPTPPELRPKRELKRAKGLPNISEDKDKPAEFKTPDGPDIGVLLAKLPESDLLPILSKLVQSHPDLKAEIMALIPPPTVEGAMEELQKASKKLAEAFPWSNESRSLAGPSTSQKPSWGYSAPLGIGFGYSQPVIASPRPEAAGGMNVSYIKNRLENPCADFYNACREYLPHFSQIVHQIPGSVVRTRCHPTETFAVLDCIMQLMLSHPALTQEVLMEQHRDSLESEWLAWVNSVAEKLNNLQFFSSTDRMRWVQQLDAYGRARNEEVVKMIRTVRERLQVVLPQDQVMTF